MSAIESALGDAYSRAGRGRARLRGIGQDARRVIFGGGGPCGPPPLSAQRLAVEERVARTLLARLPG